MIIICNKFLKIINDRNNKCNKTTKIIIILEFLYLNIYYFF